MKKRVLSLFMALALCLTLLPTAALADTADNTVRNGQDDTNANDFYTVGEDTAVQAAQTLLDALPDEVTAENAETLQEQLIAIDEALAALTDEQAAKLNTARYEALCASMTNLTAEQENGHSHPICGKTHTNVGDHTGTCEPVIWTKLTVKNNELYIGEAKATLEGTGLTKSSTYYVLQNGNYYLDKNIEIGALLKIEGAVNLCLNGHSITKTTDDLNDFEGVIVLENDSNFTLCDCQGGGKITHASGKIGRGVYGGNNAIFNMYSGEISGNYSGNSQYGQNGAGVGMKDGKFTMYGGTITGNGVNVADLGHGGGGVYVSGGSFIMHSGEISHNTSVKNGGGVSAASGSITIYGGTISNNTAATNGGGVFASGSVTVTICGGTISSNTAKGSLGGGGVFYNGTSSDKKMTVSGSAKITGNNATGNGGGVYNNGEFKVSGSVNITGNKGGCEVDSTSGVLTGGTDNNVYLPDGKSITITGALNGASIGVTSGKALDKGVSVTVAKLASGDVTYTEGSITADADGYNVVKEDDGVKLYNGGPHKHAICGTTGCTEEGHSNVTFQPLTKETLGDVKTGGAGLTTVSSYYDLSVGNYYLTANLETDETIRITGEVNLCLNGYSITAKRSDSTGFECVILIDGDSASLTLCDCRKGDASVEYGKITTNFKGRGVSLWKGSFTMYGGSIAENGVAENSTDGCGGAGVSVESNAIFTMYGGTITGNNAGNGGGGGVLVGGTFNMNGGTISGNSAVNGGGVYVSGSGTFTMSGGTIGGANEADANKATGTTNGTGNGGGVYVTSGGFTMTGDAIITGNTATDSGGGVYTSTGNATMSGGKITGNTAGNGGGVCVNLGSEFTMTNGTIGDSTTDDANTAGFGGGVCVTGGTFKMFGGKVACNTASHGGGVEVSDGAFTMEGGSITGNRAAAYGGGVKVDSDDSNSTVYGAFTMKGGSITGNDVTYIGKDDEDHFGHGGGVYVNKNAKMLVLGTVEIKDNWKDGSLGSDNSTYVQGNGSANNLYLFSSDSTPKVQKTVAIGEDGLASGALIGVSTYLTPTTGKQIKIATSANEDRDYTQIFIPDVSDKGYTIKKTGTDLYLSAHEHSWTYSASGATITATCSNAENACPNPSGGSVTIKAPTGNLTYDGNGKAATMTASNDWQGPTIDAINVYYTYGGGSTPTMLENGAVPTNANTYTASITVGEVTASVEYTIDRATPEYTAPTDLTTVYGKTLADVTLPTGWTWKDASQSVGSVGTNTFKATYTPIDANYHAVSDIDVTVKVEKAPVTITVTGMPTGPITYGDTFTLTITQTGDVAASGAWNFTQDRHVQRDHEKSHPENGEFVFRTIGFCNGYGCNGKIVVTYESATHKGSCTVNTPKINKKTLTEDDLAFNGLSTDFTKVYDGSTSFTRGEVVIKSAAKVNTADELPTVTGTYAYNSKNVEDARTVTFTSEKTETENYILPAGLVVERGATITPATITVTPDAKSKTYNAADPELTYTYTGAQNGETPAFTGTLARAAGENAGSYAINKGTLALADNGTFKAGNYTLNFSTTQMNFAINKATPEITVTPKQITKNGVEVDISDWATFNNTDTGAKLTYTLDGTPAGITLSADNKLKADPNTTVSSFTIRVSAAATTNFTEPVEKTITVNVVEKENAGVVITGLPASKTYGDADFTLTATKTAPDGGTWSWSSSNTDILEIVSGADTATPTIKVKKADATGATLTVTYTSDTHYGSVDAAITVAQKPVTITGITADDKTYDGTTTATAAGAAEIEGKVGGDDVSVIAGTAAFADKNVGTGKTVTFSGYSLSGAAAGNYTLSSQPASVTADITAKGVTVTGVTATDRQYVGGNLNVTVGGSATVSGKISDDDVTVDMEHAKGTMADANVGNSKEVIITGVALSGTAAGNYSLTAQPTGVTVNITKANAPELTPIGISQKYTVATEQSKDIGRAGMPDDAGTLTYATGSSSVSGTATVSSFTVDNAGVVKYTITGGANGAVVTLPVTIVSTNYANATVNVKITLTNKDTPVVTANDITVTYDGNAIPASAITGTASVDGTWEWKAGMAVTNVADSGSKTVVFKPTDSANYAEVEKTITVTINKATPSGAPKYTAITSGGKTLSDAGLTLADSTLNPNAGTLEWVDEDGNVLLNTTVVETNKTYKWRFTPTNTNYTSLTGSVELYHVTYGGGGSSAPTITVPVTGSRDTVHISASVSSGTAEVAEIEKSELEKVGTDSDVTIDLSGLDKSVTGVTLPKDTLRSISESEADGVTIKLPNAELRVDQKTLASAAEQAKGDKVQLVVETDRAAKDTMTAAQKQALDGMKNAAALEAYFVSNGQRIRDFNGGEVELSIPYQASGAIRAWYLKEDGTREPVSARYDKENARLILRHFSHYVIEEVESGMGYTACAKDDTCPLAAYADLVPTAWYHDGVHYCIENGLMQGVSAASFLPNGSTTRAQLVTILWRLEGSPEATGTASFTDVADGAWYAKAVRWAADSGVVKGYENGSFGPDDAVTREQMVTILYRYAQYKGYDVSVGEDTNILSFDDALTVRGYAIPAMQWACGSGLMTGIAQDGGMLLAPKDTTTRVQAATLMMRFYTECAK